jgi:hypothetical protein
MSLIEFVGDAISDDEKKPKAASEATPSKSKKKAKAATAGAPAGGAKVE